MGLLKICLVQPVQSPYWSERLQVLAKNPDLEITLYLERASFAHRPGWQPEPIRGVNVQVIGSAVFASTSDGADLGYRIQGIRSVPWRLIVKLWGLRPDVVVLCNATQLLLALPLKWLLGMRLALIVEDTAHAKRHLGALNLRLRGWLYRQADRCFAFSVDAKQFLEKVGVVDSVERSSWSLDMSRFQRASPTSPANGVAVAIGTRKVLFVGQLVPRKGIRKLLDAWQRLSPVVRINSRLLIVGEGPLGDEIRSFVQAHGMSNVVILGQLPYAEVRTLLGSADLFVLPTLEDLFSLTVVEAMASGCAVITTPFNGARELVEEGENGWLVDPTEPGALTRVLETALSEETELRQMGRRARARVEAMDNSLVMADFAQALRKLVAERT